ncbi:uncharacterized protein G2W53_002078 [Senna tora]|uniref:Uncharacterized protein n=1 Tax=Senna tora TaxID=362788 RepID=A0A834XL21_9FABA|nr:uncharacterized protein G2W53_002078 [Senna tora]
MGQLLQCQNPLAKHDHRKERPNSTNSPVTKRRTKN